MEKLIYKKVLKNGLILMQSQPEHAKGLAILQKKVFPLLAADELFQEHHYLDHIRIFPEGQFVILDGEKVIGMTTTARTHYMEEAHTFIEASGNLSITNHNPKGEWLYGLDLGIDKDYRGQGLGKLLYNTRQMLVRQLGLKGQLTVGMINGYHNFKDTLTPKEYFIKLKNGEINDPTVSIQQSIGFKIGALIEDYCNDPTCGNCGILLTMDASHII
jgi:GNAT superfamily N-acetyltransferase